MGSGPTANVQRAQNNAVVQPIITTGVHVGWGLGVGGSPGKAGANWNNNNGNSTGNTVRSVRVSNGNAAARAAYNNTVRIVIPYNRNTGNGHARCRCWLKKPRGL